MAFSNYARAQLSAALFLGEDGAARAQRWQRIVDGIASGQLRPGSRTPVAGTPAWVTLEVATGGFATGEHLAGGPLREHERTLAAPLGAPPGQERAVLNAWFLSGAGMGWLLERLESGHYRIEVPEEGALLAVAWLVSVGELARAEELVAALAPWAAQLRFFPAPATHRPASGGVFLRAAGAARAQLAAERPNPRVAAMKEAVTVWAPRIAQFVQLFLDEHAADWTDRARVLLRDYEATRRLARLTRKVDDPKENYARLRRYAQRRLDGTLTPGEREAARRIAAAYVARHGVPGSPEHEVAHAAQLRAVEAPLHAELAHQLSARLAAFPPEEGLTDPEALVAGAPAHLARKVLMTRVAPLAELLDLELIRSAESAAPLLVQAVTDAHASGISDARLRGWFDQVYGAFRRRRSLLLVNLQRQVGLHELPWVRALAPELTASPAAQQHAARELLVDTVPRLLRAFAHTITPNKLVKELRALARLTDLELPLTEELAADIFMGTFVPVWVKSAQDAARLLQGTLYERYYGVPFDEVLRLQVPEGARHVPAFAELASRLAPAATGQGSPVAHNGSVIEQAQVLTTHNLASLVQHLELREVLDWPQLAASTFSWVLRQLRQTPPGWRTRLRKVKNAASAWRQLVFYLSLSTPAAVEAFLTAAELELAQEPTSGARLRPALLGLRSAAHGEPVDAGGGRRFLGWSVGPHWLLLP